MSNVGCRKDADCNEGRDGRCRVAREGSYCTYTECTTDAECGNSGVCECGDPNRCQTGNCRVDADCGAGGFCSPSLGSCGNYGGTLGFFCHNAGNGCVDDKECQGESENGYCAYDPATAKWSCSTTQCAG